MEHENHILSLGSNTRQLLAALNHNEGLPGKFEEVLTPVQFHPQNLDDLLGLPGDLDYPDETFDALVSCAWHEFTPWLRWSFQEVHRVLKVGAKFTLVLPVRENAILGQREGRAADPAREFFRKILGKPPNTRTFGLVQPVLEELGLKVDKITGVKPKKTGLLKTNIDFRNTSIPIPTVGANDYVMVTGYKSSSSWQTDPFLRDRDIVNSIIERDFSTQKSALIDLKAKFDDPPAQSFQEYVDTKRTALLLSPHPDDELIGAGGTIIQMVKEGVDVTVMQLTNGRNCTTLANQKKILRNTIRHREANRVAAQIGIHCILFSGEDDDLDLKALSRLTNLVTKQLLYEQPELVFVPALNDPHPDHKAAGTILRNALVKSGAQPDVLQYEVTTFCLGNVFSEIGDQATEKTLALRQYRTALRSVNYIRVSQLLSAWHSFELTNHAGQLEMFHLTDSAGFIELHDKMR
jgi:N-acetylglucosamine malate deacetylase 1